MLKRALAVQAVRLLKSAEKPPAVKRRKLNDKIRYHNAFRRIY